MRLYRPIGAYVDDIDVGISAVFVHIETDSRFSVVI